MSDRTINVHVGSKSPVKLAAVENAFGRFGYQTELRGYSVESGVDEQPLTIGDAHEGARNRHEALRLLVGDKAGYLVTVESGVIKPFEGAPWKGCEAVIIERLGGESMTGFDLGVEYPQSMMDKVPSKYPDLGVLMQEEYGFTEKDPVTFLTGGRLSRVELIEQALVKVLAQMDDDGRAQTEQ